MTALQASSHAPSAPRRRKNSLSKFDDDSWICRQTAAVAAVAFGVGLRDLRAASRRGADVAFARQTAMYLAHVIFGLALDAVGRHFRRDRTTAAHACRLIEDRRDDPAFERLVILLEEACIELAAGMRGGAR